GHPALSRGARRGGRYAGVAQVHRARRPDCSGFEPLGCLLSPWLGAPRCCAGGTGSEPGVSRAPMAADRGIHASAPRSVREAAAREGFAEALMTFGPAREANL